MSTITVSNINDGTTSVPSTYVTNGSAKAWINFNSNPDFQLMLSGQINQSNNILGFNKWQLKLI